MTSSKNFTVKKKGTRSRATAADQPGRPVPFKACTTRFKDSRTGKFTSAPAAGAAPVLKAKATDYRLPTVSREDGLSVLTIREKGGAVKSVKVRDLQGRQKAKTAPTRTKRKKALADVRKTERDLSLIERDKLGGVSADDHAEAMRDQFNSDKSKRGAVSRKRNAAARSADKRRNPYRYQPKAKATGQGGRA